MPARRRLIGEGCDLVDDYAAARCVVRRILPVRGEAGVELLWSRVERIGETRENLALLGVERLARVCRHDVGGDDSLEHRDLCLDLARNSEVRVEADEALPLVDLARRRDGSPREPAD